MTANNAAVVAGVDLGATSVRVGLFTPAGQALDVRAAALETPRKVDSGLRQTIALLEESLAACGAPPLLGIGVGSTGPVNPLEGTVISPLTEPAWQFVPLTRPLSAHFGVPCVLENDADAAALGEYWQGAGQKTARLLAVTVGTGIGVALIVDGQVYRGLDGGHPEAGHHILDASGPLCYCGVNGCWESLASGEAISAAARQQAQANPGWLAQLGVADAQAINGAVVAQAARQGDPAALAIFQREGQSLALGLLNMMAVYLPEQILLTGAVMRSYDLLEETIARTLARPNPMIPAERVKITPAKLGYYAGVTGAAFAMLQALGKTEPVELQ